MGLLKYIARNDWLRCLVGGVVSAGAVFALVSHQWSAMLWAAVTTAFLIGAMCSFAGETIVEAMVKVLIVSFLFLAALSTLDKVREKAHRMKEKAAERAKLEGREMATQNLNPGMSLVLKVLSGMGIGFLGGMAVGTLMGAVFRLLDERPVFRRPPAEGK